MNKLELVKTGICIVVSGGVGTIVGNAVKATSPANMKLLTKFSVAIGSFVLSGLLGDMAAVYAENIMDTGIETVNTVKDVISNQESEEEEA